MYWGSPRTSIPVEERLAQTRRTIDSLLDAGVDEIYLADNSGPAWEEGTEDSLAPAHVRVYDHYQFQNKGISELYLLLCALEQLPPGGPILKISGRYRLSDGLRFGLEGADVAAKFIPYAKSQQWMSTRCYMVRNREVYERFLKATLRDLYGYPARIVGLGSLLRIVRNSLFPGRDDSPYDDPLQPIEVAAARVLQGPGYKVRRVDALGIEGITGDEAQRLLKE